MDRKALVKTLSEHFGVKARYLGAPSFAYEIRSGEQAYTIDREGTIMDERGQVIQLREVLHPEEEPAVEAPFAILLPLDGHDGRTLRNMLNMIYSKQALIRKALGLQENLIEAAFINALNEGTLTSLEDFKQRGAEAGWEHLPGIAFDFVKDEMTIRLPEDATGAEELFTLIYKLSKKQKKASFKPKATTNEKYTFRTWLLRLGMIGEDYKEARQWLLKHLSGNGAFKGGDNHEA